LPWYEIEKSQNLTGEIYVQGSKNSVLPILAATLLVKGKTFLYGCPMISDVEKMLSILRLLGCDAHARKGAGGWDIAIDSSGLSGYVADGKDVEEMRASIIFLGALLSATGYVKIAYPGGCHIGERPVDMHIEAFEKMGAELCVSEHYIEGKTDGFVGKEITLRKRSVGTTENILIASVTAKGRTVIHNASKEPEIIELSKFLNAAGGKIRGMGTDTIVVEGVKKLKECRYTVSGDRIVAATYMAAVNICGGKVLIRNVNHKWCSSSIEVLRRAGTEIICRRNEMLVCMKRQRPLCVKEIITGPYPETATDIQPFLTVSMCLADGMTVIKETIFENRFASAYELRKMGARIALTDNNTAVIVGVNEFRGADVTGHDLRGGAALILAGMRAEGITRVKGAEYICRGYEDIVHDLGKIGGRIRYADEEENNHGNTDIAAVAGDRIISRC